VPELRNTPADVGAHASWAAGRTGDGVRIAVIDTGVDPLHQDLDDLDFRHWSPSLAHHPLVSPRKVVDARDFNGSSQSPVCPPRSAVTDGNGHGTHVAGIALGTGEGKPADSTDDGKHAGVAPGAELAVAKALTDAGTGVESDVLAALEWAALPEDPSPLGCSIGADIVNLSIGSEARPGRLNSGEDMHLMSLTLNRLAAKYGTLFVGAVGNSGPYMGSSLEAPGSAAQVLSVGAGPKDYDLNHDDTLSGDTCAGWTHDDPPAQPAPIAALCGPNPSPLQPPSLASFSSRGTGATWLRPDIVGPGYYIVSAQSSTGATLAAIDTNPNTQGANDLLYATASGTSMATPAVAGSAALVLEAYRDRYGGADPSGASGLSGFRAPAHALLKAALMNTARPNLYEARQILTVQVPLAGTQSVKTDPRNGSGDPYVGPLTEGAGKVDAARAIAALRDGVVVYSGASGSGDDRGTGPRDLQGSWQVGAIQAGQSQSQTFVLHSAPGAPSSVAATFGFEPGNPSDGSRAISAGRTAGSWLVRLPGRTTVRRGRDEIVRFTLAVPSTAAPGSYTGTVVVTLSNGQTLRIPVHAAVALHDPNYAAGNAPGAQARVSSARDVYGRDTTTWPSVAGAALGAQADWLVFPVELGSGLTSASFKVYDSADGDETYDLYLYGADLDLERSTHPFVPGTTTTDPVANDQRGPSTEASPQVLTVANPAPGRHYLVVNRAKPGLSPGDFGSFVLTLDEVRPASGEGGGGGGDDGCGDDEDDEVSVAGPETAARGDEVTYDVAYTNGGSDDDDDCEVEDELDDDTDFKSASGGGTYDPSLHTVTWKLGGVPAGATVRMRVTATVSANAAPGTVLVNRALVGGLGLPAATAFAQTVVVP
jgi:subtilisin family serine protease